MMQVDQPLRVGNAGSRAMKVPGLRWHALQKDKYAL
jgi:hypothetical protein